jgi:cob(I)alamin adenosyltransferase
MGHRLSKIATRTGDGGETGLGDGKRVPKDSARIQALGDVDELNSALGLVLAEEVPPAVRDAFGEAQLLDLLLELGDRLLEVQEARFHGGILKHKGFNMAPWPTD